MITNAEKEHKSMFRYGNYIAQWLAKIHCFYILSLQRIQWTLSVNSFETIGLLWNISRPFRKSCKRFLFSKLVDNPIFSDWSAQLAGNARKNIKMWTRLFLQLKNVVTTLKRFGRLRNITMTCRKFPYCLTIPAHGCPFWSREVTPFHVTILTTIAVKIGFPPAGVSHYSWSERS